MGQFIPQAQVDKAFETVRAFVLCNVAWSMECIILVYTYVCKRNV